MQTRIQSFLEANFNTFSGTLINWTAGMVIYPLFGLSVSMLDVTGITLCFTLLSVARNYCVRRFFNNRKAIVTERKTYHLCAEGCDNVSKISDTRTKILRKDPLASSTLKEILNAENHHVQNS